MTPEEKTELLARLDSIFCTTFCGGGGQESFSGEGVTVVAVMDGVMKKHNNDDENGYVLSFVLLAVCVNICPALLLKEVWISLMC